MASRLFHTSGLAERLRTVLQHHERVHSQMYVFNAGLHWDSCTDLQSAALFSPLFTARSESPSVLVRCLK